MEGERWKEGRKRGEREWKEREEKEGRGEDVCCTPLAATSNSWCGLSRFPWWCEPSQRVSPPSRLWWAKGQGSGSWEHTLVEIESWSSSLDEEMANTKTQWTHITRHTTPHHTHQPTRTKYTIWYKGERERYLMVPGRGKTCPGGHRSKVLVSTTGTTWLTPVHSPLASHSWWWWWWNSSMYYWCHINTILLILYYYYDISEMNNG